MDTNITSRHEDLNCGRWAAHGEFEIQVVDRFLQVTFFDAFNRQGAARVSDRCRDLAIHHLCGKSEWAQLLDFRLFELTTPDASEVVQEYYAWAFEHGLRCEALITSNVVSRDLMSKMLVPFQSKFKLGYFSDISEAKDWLRSLGYAN